MPTTAERSRPKRRSKAPAIREVCLIGDPARRYLHTDLIDVGPGLRRGDRAAEVGRRGKPCLAR